MRLPDRGGVAWYGDPLSKQGAILMTFPQTRPAEVEFEMFRLFTLKNGWTLTPELAAMGWQRAVANEKKMLQAIAGRGVAADVRRLFAAKTKKDAERIADEIHVTGEQFHDLTYNSGKQLGLSHHAAHYEFLPEQSRIPSVLSAEFWASDRPSDDVTQRIFDKLEQANIERVHRSVHLYASSRKDWHSFYLTFGDVFGNPANHPRPGHHWTAGSHLHYTSSLYNPRMTKQQLWDAMDERRVKVDGSHVRYVDTVPEDPGKRVFVDDVVGRARVMDVPKR
jgi:hypothetical protein